MAGYEVAVSDFPQSSAHNEDSESKGRIADWCGSRVD
jgi:hypothetical protein